MKFRLPRAAVPLVLLLGLAAGSARADLVWTAQTGWQIQGGVMSGLTGEEGRTALDLMNKARNAEERGSFHSAIRTYTKVTKSYPSSVYAPEAFYQIAKMRLERRQYYKAFDAYQEILSRYPNDKRFGEVLDQEYTIAESLLDGARNHIWGVIPGFPNREKGVQDFEIILADAPYSDYAPLALMNIARGHEYLHEKEEAIDALDRLINTYQQSVLAPEAYLRLAGLHAALVDGPYYDQGESKQAISYYTDFMILYPGDQKIGAAASGLDRMKTMLALSKIEEGDFYFYKRDNFTAARVFYNEAITSYPDSPVAQQAKDRLVSVEAKASGAPVPGAPGAKKKHFLFF